MTTAKAERAERLVNRLIKLSDSPALKLRAQQLLDRMQLPIADILAKVPGETVIEKAARIGISRQTYYAWRRGASWPSIKQAKRIGELTGVDWRDINGKTTLSPSRSPLPSRASRSV